MSKTTRGKAERLARPLGSAEFRKLREETCDVCDGRGRYRPSPLERRRLCPACQGSGVVSQEPEVEQEEDFHAS